MSVIRKRVIAFVCIYTLLTGGVLATTTKSGSNNWYDNYDSNISFYYENLMTGEKLVYNSSRIYPAASTVKLPLVLYVYELAAAGQLDLDSKMHYSEDYYYEGTGILRYHDFGGQYTLRELAEYSMCYSDNIAYSMLISKVGYRNFKEYLKSLGGDILHRMGYRYINAEDYAIYIKAYQKFIDENDELGVELHRIWTETEFNEHIPNALNGVTVGHKIGWLPKSKIYHDGGVAYDEIPYVLIIMARNYEKEEEISIFNETTTQIHEHHNETMDKHINDYVNLNMVSIQWLNKYISTRIHITDEGQIETINFGMSRINIEQKEQFKFKEGMSVYFFDNQIYVDKKIVNEVLKRREEILESELSSIQRCINHLSVNE